MRARGPLLFAVVALLFVGACGGGGDDSSDEQPAGAQDADDESDTGGDVDLSAKDCLFALDTLTSNPLASAFSGNADPDELENSVDLFEEIAADAPEEIRDDFAVIADAYGKVVQVLVEADFDPNDPSGNPEALAKLAEIGQEIDQAAVNQASSNISAYFEEHCPAA